MNLDFRRLSPDEVDEGDLILLYGFQVRTVDRVEPPVSPQVADRDEHWVIVYHTGKWNQGGESITQEFWVYPGNRVVASKDGY